jgi:hypothetical protein
VLWTTPFSQEASTCGGVEADGRLSWTGLPGRSAHGPEISKSAVGPERPFGGVFTVIDSHAPGAARIEPAGTDSANAPCWATVVTFEYAQRHVAEDVVIVGGVRHPFAAMRF